MEDKFPELAEKYPDGVWFKETGYPDFSPYAIKTVRIEGLTGDRRHDAKLSNKACGLDKTPKGYTWHHVEDGETMQLVPSDLHGISHTGGRATIKNLEKLK